MTITYPDHWKEPYQNKGPKYDKICQMIDELNTPTVPAPPSAHHLTHEEGGSDEVDPALHAGKHHSGGGDQMAHQSISGAGSNDHAAIDTHLGASNPHSGHVDTSGDETIAGVKTFSSFPVSPSSYPSTSYQLANKLYVDLIAQYARSQFPSQGDFSTGSNPTSYSVQLNPFNTYWTIYYVGTPNSYHRVMPAVIGTGPWTYWWMVNASYGTAGTAMGLSIAFKLPVSTSYTADIYLNGSPNSGSYWYYRVYLDSTQKYSGQPSGYNVLNVSLGSLTAGTTYYFKQELYNNITCGPHTGTFYIQAVIIRPT